MQVMWSIPAILRRWDVWESETCQHLNHLPRGPFAACHDTNLFWSIGKLETMWFLGKMAVFPFRSILFSAEKADTAFTPKLCASWNKIWFDLLHRLFESISFLGSLVFDTLWLNPFFSRSWGYYKSSATHGSYLGRSKGSGMAEQADGTTILPFC